MWLVKWIFSAVTFPVFRLFSIVCGQAFPDLAGQYRRRGGLGLRLGWFRGTSKKICRKNIPPVAPCIWIHNVQPGFQIGAYINKAGAAQSTTYIEIENHGILFSWLT